MATIPRSGCVAVMPPPDDSRDWSTAAFACCQQAGHDGAHHFHEATALHWGWSRHIGCEGADQ